MSRATVARKAIDARILFPILGFCVLLVLGENVCPVAIASGSAESVSSPLTSKDTYYQTKGVVSSPRPPVLTDADYPRPSELPISESRVVIWVLAQQHNYWGAFVFGVLVLTVLLEIGSLVVRPGESAQRYDGCAHEILRLVVLALSVAAALGGLLLFGLLALYPDLTRYLASVFRPFFLGYGLLLIVFNAVVYLYYSTWQRMSAGLPKWVHASLGVLACSLGTLLVLISNAWGSFMLSPAGVDQYGRFLGNYWHVLHTATWNSFNVHRIAGHIVFGAAVIAAYAAYRALTERTREDRARYDWMAYVAVLTVVFPFFTIPAGGYWLSREIYTYRQEMGITMFGGLLAWWGTVLVLLVAAMLLGVNYYIWQRISSTDQAERYRHYPKYVFLVLAFCTVPYITPAIPVMTPLERKTVIEDGFKHTRVWSNYGQESAKQPAINIMMIVTMWSLITWWKCQQQVEQKVFGRSDLFLNGFFVLAIANLLWMGIYGYYIPANVRVGLQIPMVATTFSVMIMGLFVYGRTAKMSQRSQTGWGNLSVRGYYALFFIAFAISWVMGLGGYRRSSLRLYWHVNEIMRDNSSWAFTNTIGIAANIITLNAIIFWLGLLLLVWMARLGKDRLEGTPSS